MDLEQLRREFDLLCDEFSRINAQQTELKRVLNVNDAEITEGISDLKNGNVPVELHETLLAANAAAKEAGNVRAMRAKPASKTSAGGGRTARRQGVVRLN